VRTLLKKRWDIAMSKSAVCRLLQNLGLSPQRPIYRSYKRDPSEMEEYLNVTLPELERRAKGSGAKIYFVDESAIRSDHHRGTTCGLIGEAPVVEDSGDRFGMKLISAVTLRGDMRFSAIDGRMISEVVIDVLQKLRTDAGRPIIVIADSARHHTSAMVVEFMASTNGDTTLATLPRYSPELNPDEQVWNHAKRRFSQEFIDSKETMKSTVFAIMHSIQRTRSLVQSFSGCLPPATHHSANTYATINSIQHFAFPQGVAFLCQARDEDVERSAHSRLCELLAIHPERTHIGHVGAEFQSDNAHERQPVAQLVLKFVVAKVVHPTQQDRLEHDVARPRIRRVRSPRLRPRRLPDLVGCLHKRCPVDLLVKRQQPVASRLEQFQGEMISEERVLIC
jgi:transposase